MIVARSVSDSFHRLHEDLRNKLLLKLSEKDKTLGDVIKLIAENFHELPHDIRNLLMEFSKRDGVSGIVARSVEQNFHDFPEDMRNKLLLGLSEKDEAAGDVAKSVAENFHELPDDVRNLLFKLSEKDEAAGAVAWAVADNFRKLPDDVRNLLLLRLSEKDEAAKDVARSVAHNFHELPDDVRNKLLLKLSEKDEAAGDVAWAVAQNFHELPDDVRNKLLLKLSEKDKSAREVARTLRNNFHHFPEDIRNNLLLKLSEKDKAAEVVGGIVAKNFDEFPDSVSDELLLKLSKKSERLLEEDIRVTERLQNIISQLRDEKKKKFFTERDAAWKDVAFKAAHKLGNPLDAIETFLYSLERHIGMEDTNEMIAIYEKMEECIEEAKSVLAQFKSLTKSQEVNRELIDIEEIIEQAFKTAKHMGIDVKIESIGKIPKVAADPDRMIEVFSELLANSLNWFDKDVRKIYVEIRRVHKGEIPPDLDSSTHYLRITFTDNGCGIPLSEKDRIFAPFYTTYPHGSGLGLAIVKWIIEAHNGMIIEEGRFGEGAEFVIFLPATNKGEKKA